jgi:transaldolase
LWASTGTKDARASPTLYVDGLAAPFTVNTMPEATLRALASKDTLGAALPLDGGDSEAVLGEFAASGVDVTALAARLQDEGAAAFVKSWKELLAVIDEKGGALRKRVAAEAAPTYAA